jgi:hypothetical protein
VFLQHQTLAEFGITEQRFYELKKSPRAESSRMDTGRAPSHADKNSHQPASKRQSMNAIFSKTHHNISSMTQEPLKTTSRH